MQKTAISTRQAFFLATPLLVIIGHFLLVPLYLGWAGRDAWIGILAAFGLGAVLFAGVGKLNEMLYGGTIIERLLQWFGPWLGRLAALPFLLYYFMLSVITLYGYAIFVSSVFLVGHSLLLITFTFSLVMLYLVSKGIEVIARVSEWVLFYNIITGILVSLALAKRKEYAKLLPMLADGIGPVIPVTVLVLSVFGELLVMLMVNVRREGKNSLSHVGIYMVLLLVNLIIFPSTTIGPVAIFGEEQARHLAFPVESSVRLIDVGFIERFDIYGLTIMTISTLLRLGLLHYSVSVATAQWFSMKSYKWMNWAIGAVLIYTSVTAFDDYLDYMDDLKRYYPYGILASGTILLLWLFAAVMQKRVSPKPPRN